MRSVQAASCCLNGRFGATTTHVSVMLLAAPRQHGGILPPPHPPGPAEPKAAQRSENLFSFLPLPFHPLLMCNLISEAWSSALADFSALEWKELTA